VTIRTSVLLNVMPCGLVHMDRELRRHGCLSDLCLCDGGSKLICNIGKRLDIPEESMRSPKV
jgi:hypothetical protein